MLETFIGIIAGITAGIIDFVIAITLGCMINRLRQRRQKNDLY